MRTLIRLGVAFCKVVIWTMVGLLVYGLISCNVRYYPVENYQKDSIYIKQYERDSVYFRDSVFVHTKADTVFLNRIQYKYREMVIRDTVRVMQCDTTTVVREVERKLTKLQQTQMDIGRGVMWAVPFVVIFLLFILYCKLKR